MTEDVIKHRGEYTLDTSRDRLQMPAIISWIQNAYWARGRSAEEVKRSWDASSVVCGVYQDETQIGCARVVTDGVGIAYLADVYIGEAYRGSGLGRWMVESLVNHPELQTVHWLLHTRDAHALYAQVGFGRPGERVMERRRRET